MKTIIPYFILILIIWTACTSFEDNISKDKNLQLIFSSDTVSFDTLLTAKKSATQRLIIKNPNKNAIKLDEIRLSKNSADYQLIINGQPTNQSLSEVIPAKDSLLIIIESTISPRNKNKPYLIEAGILFSWNENRTRIPLITYGQDTKKLAKKTVCNEVWRNTRPYLISDTIFVEKNCELTIEKGATLFFEKNGALVVNGKLKAIGDTSQYIVFKNTRFDNIFSETAGQWKGILLTGKEQTHQLAYVKISNADVALKITETKVTIQNTEIKHMKTAGILAESAEINMTNSLIYNCGNYMAGHFGGGKFNYTHCTFSNVPSLFSFEKSSVYFDGSKLEDEKKIELPLSVNLTNCIIWGNKNEELLIKGEKLTSKLNNNIIRSNKKRANNFNSQRANFPGFKNYSIYDYSLDTLAFAQNKGIKTSVIKDIKDITRDEKPDIGAFERVDKKGE